MAEGRVKRRLAVILAVSTEYPGLGFEPKKNWWRWRRGARGIRFRLSCILRAHLRLWARFEWYVATVRGSHRYLQLVCRRAGPGRHVRPLHPPLFHNPFNDEDALTVENMTMPT